MRIERNRNNKIMALKLKIGSPVIGEDFYGRDVELERAEALIQDNNLMLAAPRRVGKTSFAKRLMDVQGAKGWNTIFIDLEQITNINHFFKAFHDELMALPEVRMTDKVMSRVKKWVSGLELSTQAGPVQASIKANSTDNDDFNGLAEVLNALEHHTLIVFDELTVLLESLTLIDNDGRTVRMFLNQFRALRSSTAESCSWLICSSVGVRNYTIQHNLSDTINDVADFDLGAYSDAEATEFVSLLAQTIGIEIDDKTVRHMLAKIGWNIPYFIQLLMSRLPKGKVTKAAIDDAYNHLLKTGSFDTWHERLNKEYGNNKDVAKLVLQYLCVNTEGKPRDEIFNYLYARFSSFDNDSLGLLLRALMTDGYLVKDGELYRFRSPLLRDYWKETYC